MSFLTPWTALIAALLAVPPLLLLYFLKLRRREVTIPSTLLWQRAVEDLQANSPFQRLRPSWLLLLQLLLLAALILAIGRPMMGSTRETASRVILLLDVSASMSARLGTATATAAAAVAEEPARTRFDAAKDEALQIIDRLAGAGEAAEGMIIAVGGRARTVASPTSDLRRLRAAVETLQPTDEVGRLEPALRLAEAFLRESAAGDGDDPTPTRIILISDGRLADESSVELRAEQSLEFIAVPSMGEADDVAAATDATGEPGRTAPTNPGNENRRDLNRDRDNVGFVTLAARRDYADPTQVDVFASLVNCSTRERIVAVRLELDGVEIDVRTVTIPPTDPDDTSPGETGVRFSFRNTSGGLVRVAHSHRDLLRSDNAAAMVLDTPRQSAILAVSPEGRLDGYLRDVLALLDLADIQNWNEDVFNRTMGLSPEERAERLAPFDLIIFDRVTPIAAPSRSTLSFGGMVPLEGVSRELRESVPARSRVLSWDARHPLMYDVALDPIVIGDQHRLVLPEAARMLALGEGGTLIGVVDGPGGRYRHVGVSFDLIQSNWPVHYSFAIFVRNAVEQLTMRGQIEAGRWVAADESLPVRAAPGVRTIQVSGPVTREVPVNADGGATIPALGRAGVYRVDGVAPPTTTVAVNVLSPIESDLRPVDTITVGREPVLAVRGSETVPREVWTWFIIGAIVITLAEWLLYTIRVGVN